MGTTLAEKALSIVDDVLRSELTSAQAGDLLAHLGAAARVIEIDELQRRVEAIARSKP